MGQQFGFSQIEGDMKRGRGIMTDWMGRCKNVMPPPPHHFLFYLYFCSVRQGEPTDAILVQGNERKPREFFGF